MLRIICRGRQSRWEKLVDSVPPPTHCALLPHKHLTPPVDSGWVMPVFPPYYSPLYFFYFKKTVLSPNQSTRLNSTFKSSVTQRRLAVFSTLSVLITNAGFLIKGEAFNEVFSCWWQMSMTVTYNRSRESEDIEWCSALALMNNLNFSYIIIRSDWWIWHSWRVYG